jgi:hypothetical protein
MIPKTMKEGVVFLLGASDNIYGTKAAPAEKKMKFLENMGIPSFEK